tara:strand:- start:1709 stop:1948 length:240 start_codon:yes stop_codon:yes gene_type:complete
MTYQNTTAPSSVAQGVHRALDGVGSFFGAIGRAMMVNSMAHQRLARIHALQAKPDQELAALRIKRENIVHEVFKDLYYL